MEKLLQTKRSIYLDDGVVISLRPVTIGDHLWCQQTFKKSVGEVLSASLDGNSEGTLKLIYNQIPYDERELFKVEEHNTFDDNGNNIVIRIGGWKKMARLFGEGGFEKALEAYTQSLKDGHPAIRKDESGGDDSGKK